MCHEALSPCRKVEETATAPDGRLRILDFPVWPKPTLPCAAAEYQGFLLRSFATHWRLRTALNLAAHKRSFQTGEGRYKSTTGRGREPQPSSRHLSFVDFFFPNCLLFYSSLSSIISFGFTIMGWFSKHEPLFAEPQEMEYDRPGTGVPVVSKKNPFVSAMSNLTHLL